MSAIYLDYNATTPVDPAVLKTLHEVAARVFGNPSSTHRPGTAGREVVDRARTQLADLIGAESDEIVFTSGGSEANNLALKGSSGKRAGGTAARESEYDPDRGRRFARRWESPRRAGSVWRDAPTFGSLALSVPRLAHSFR